MKSFSQVGIKCWMLLWASCLLGQASAQPDPATPVAPPVKPAWGDGEGGLFAAANHRADLKLDVPGANGWNGRVVATGKPGALFFPGEAVDVDVKLTGVKPEEALTLELVPIDQPMLAPDGADLLFMPNYGIAPRAPAVTITPRYASPEDAAAGLLKLRNLPVKGFGPVAVVLIVKDRGRQAVGTVARGHQPRRGSRWDSQVMYHMGGISSWEDQIPVVARIGYRWIRPDNFPNWQGSDGGGPDKPFNFEKQDQLMNKFKEQGLYLISNAYGSPMWAIDPANFKAYFYAHGPELDPLFSKWAEEAARRWNGPDGEGPLQMIDYWNEPWEGGGISAWRGDAPRYRQLYQAIYEGMKKGSPKMLIGGTSSIMNTGDKFMTTPELQKEWEPKVEILTDHYVQPAMSYGPRVARRMNVMSMESETWFGGNARYAAGTLAFFLSSGQKIVNINHPAQLLWSNSPGVLMTKSSAVALNTYCHFAGDRPFEQIVFHHNLPWLFQFGKGKSAAFLMLGDASHLVANHFDRIRANGSISLGTRNGLTVYDVYGNPLPARGGKVVVPLNRDAYWLVSPRQDAAQVIKTVQQGVISGVKPVDLVLQDLQHLPAPGSKVTVKVRNVLNRPVMGTVTLQVPAGLTLAQASQPVTLRPGETAALAYTLAEATPDPNNAYQVTAKFQGKDGENALQETLQANLIARGTPTIDGDLNDWNAVPAVRGASGKDVADPTLKLWKPWEDVKEVSGGFADFKAMYDDQFLYISIRERNSKWGPRERLSTRDDDKYFGKTPATEHTYWHPGFNIPDPGDNMLPYYGNIAQIAIGLGLGSKGHDLPEPEKVPSEFVAMPDTDYEYAVWGTPDGGSEIWRNLAAEWRWPKHFAPRTIPKGAYNGVPEKAKAAVRKAGNDVIYEVALPWADMPQFKPEMIQPGKSLFLTFKMPGSGVLFGSGKSATRPNGMSTLPRWELSPSNSIAWGIQ